MSEQAEMAEGMMISEENGVIIFRAREFEEQSLSRTKIAEGINLMTESHFGTIREIVFDGDMFTKDEAIAFLRDQMGMEPGDSGAFMFSDPGEHVLLADIMHEDEQFKFEEVQIDGMRMLAVSATALTAGDWAGHHFPLAVVQEAAERLNRAPICVEHQFTDPGDVKGVVSRSFAFNQGIKADFLVHDELTINQITSGDKGAVSVNFIAATDKEKNITKIRKFFELTVCKHPRCADAVIENSKEVTVNFIKPFSAEKGENGEKDSLLASPEAEIGGLMTDESQDDASLQLAEEKAKNLEKELEDIRAQLAEKDTQLAEKDVNMAALQKASEESENRIASLESTVRLSMAKKDVETFIKTMKFAKAAESNLVDFYVKLSDEQQKEFSKLVEALPAQVQLGAPGEEGVPAEGRPPNETVAEQTDSANDEQNRVKMAEDLESIVNKFKAATEGQRAMTPEGRIRGGY